MKQFIKLITITTFASVVILLAIYGVISFIIWKFEPINNLETRVVFLMIWVATVSILADKLTTPNKDK